MHHDHKDDEKRLPILLKHWVDHNRSHGEEFQRWVDRANALGLDSTARQIDQAADLLDQASDTLLAALNELEGG